MQLDESKSAVEHFSVVASEVWEKQKATYEITTLVYQAHLMHKLDVCNLMSQKVQLSTFLPLHVLSYNCKTLDYLPLMISLRPSSC